MDDGASRSIAEWALHVGADVDAPVLRASLAAGTIVDVAEVTATRWPDRPALRVGAGSVTHAELRDTSRRVAGWLRSQGRTDGAAVLVAGPNSIALVVAYLAVLRSGAMVHLVNPTFGVNELSRTLGRVDPFAVVAVDEMPSKLREAGSGVPDAGARPRLAWVRQRTPTA